MHLAGRTWGWGRRLLIEDPVQGHVLLDTFSLLCEDGGCGRFTSGNLQQI